MCDLMVLLTLLALLTAVGLAFWYGWGWVFKKGSRDD